MTSTWAIIEIEVTRQCRTSLCLLAAAVIAVTLGSGGSSAQEMTVSPEALRQIAQVEAEIDRIEAQTLERLAAPPDNLAVRQGPLRKPQ